MTMKRQYAKSLRISAVVGIIALVILLLSVVPAQAITFGDWAATQGWPGNVTPATVNADVASIDSLIGIGDYNWLTTPTRTLFLDHNQITSIESSAFSGLGNVTSLYLDYNQITSIESGDFTGLGNLTVLYLWGNQITSIESGDFSGLGS